MTEYLKLIIDELMQSAELPLLAALLLGILVALNPCQLAINISALTYMSRKVEERKKLWMKGIEYAAGRTLTYTLLGWILMYAMKKGVDVDSLQYILGHTEDVLPYVLIAIGVFLILRTFFHKHRHGSSCHNSGQAIRHSDSSGAFFLGMVLALAFCPESAIFYFGMMIPLALSSHAGYAIPFLFAFAAAIPVVAVAVLVSSAIANVQKLEHSMEHFQFGLNLITGIVLSIIGVLFLF